MFVYYVVFVVGLMGLIGIVCGGGSTVYDFRFPIGHEQVPRAYSTGRFIDHDYLLRGAGPHCGGHVKT
jgi:hypothetical protein